MRSDIRMARGYIEDINSWEIQSIKPSDKGGDAWDVVLGSTPRIVGDLLPGYDEGSEDGIVFPLQPRDGTAEFDETVQLRRDPPVPPADADTDDDVEPGVVMWGTLTCAYESRDGGTFEGTIAFYEDEAEGAALMSVAATDVTRAVVARGLDEVDSAITLLEGNGAHVVDHGDRILGHLARLNAILADGITARKTAE